MVLLRMQFRQPHNPDNLHNPHNPQIMKNTIFVRENSELRETKTLVTFVVCHLYLCGLYSLLLCSEEGT